MVLLSGSSARVLRGAVVGALAGFLLGAAVGLLVAVVHDGDVNALFFGAIGAVVGAGVAGERPRKQGDRPDEAS